MKESIIRTTTNIDEGNWLEMNGSNGKTNGSVSMPLSFLPKHLQTKAKKRPVKIKIVISEDVDTTQCA